MFNIENENIERMIIPVSNSILLPGISQVIRLSRLSEEELQYLESEEPICIALPLKQNFDEEELSEEDFSNVGVLFKVDKMEEKETGYQMNISTLERIEIKEITVKEDIVLGTYEIAEDINDLTEEAYEDMLKFMKKITHETGAYFKGSEAIVKLIDEIMDLNKLIGYVAQFMRISREDKYELLELESLKERSLRFVDHLLKHKEGIKLQLEISQRLADKTNKTHRENLLREQLRIVQEELNDGNKNKKDYRKKIEEANMPAEVEAVALEELSKFESQSPTSSDYNVIRNYLDVLVQLPWGLPETKSIDIDTARKILNDQHYGLEKVKERILQHLAVMKLKKGKKGSIILLVGPPGTGKTSLGKSIAEALDRKYIRLSLGGVKDESEIRGHRRTYVGAMPGRFIQSIKKAGTRNPVMILDEIDKLSTSYNGDPASALLEVLDPEQNDTFRDHYLDVPFDLSEVFFIATANSLDTIPRPLLDRMEVIQISSYTINEKFHIGKNHLVPEIIEEHGLTNEQLVIKESALRKIIDDYTVEAGVRGLKKQIATIARVASEKVVTNKVELPYVVEAEMLEEILGRQVARHDKVKNENPIGVVTGLAWTPVGGEILLIEATDMPGNGQVILTGKLGDVMKESARISLSLLKSRLAADAFNFKERDLHVHVPSGAVPKDGPSAGIALFTAFASLVTGIKIDSRLGMTGEITLRGAVLPIGGLKEKLIAAHRAGVTKVLIPKDNEADLKDVPDEVKSQLTIIPVETVEEVINETLSISIPRLEHVFSERVSAEAAFALSK